VKEHGERMTDDLPESQSSAGGSSQRGKADGIAVAALVLGIVGALLSLIPVAGLFLCGLPALLAIIFGFIGLRRSKNFMGPDRGFSLWGIVLGFSPILLATIINVIVTGIHGVGTTSLNS
jgi:hypothetical protein